MTSLSRLAKSLLPALLLAPLLLAISGSTPAMAQNTAVSVPEKMDAPETKSETEQFRHAKPVQSLARIAHLSTETTAKILEDLNSAILIAVIAWFLLRLMPKVLRKRSETLQKQLLEARLATSQANERLSVVEERLSKLGIEIDAIRQQTEQDSLADEKRIQESLEAERKRIVASAEQDIEAAGSAVRRDLKKYAAGLAVDSAMRGLQLSAEDDYALIHKFADGLKGDRN